MATKWLSLARGSHVSDSDAHSFLPTVSPPTCGTQEALAMADKSLLLAYG